VTIRTVEDESGWRLKHVHGATETGPLITTSDTRRLFDPDDDGRFAIKKKQGIGYPVTEVRGVDEDGHCGVCAMPCREKRAYRRLEPGESAEFDWTGATYVRDSEHGRACWRTEIPRIGESLAAEFRWSPGGQRGTLSKRMSFSYGEDRTVEYTVESDRDRNSTPTTFKIVNDTNQPIRYQESAGCTHPAWVRFADDAVAANGSTCEMCMCEQLEQDGRCRVCSVRCAPPQIGSLAPGESLEWTWEGYVHTRDEVDDETCYRKTVPSHGRHFEVDLCWKIGDGPTGRGELQNPTCIGHDFAYGEQTTVVDHIQYE
jgi:hypothetical protein